jgi:hypothetical protein
MLLALLRKVRMRKCYSIFALKNLHVFKLFDRVLRSCNLIGSVPEYLGTITNLQSL